MQGAEVEFELVSAVELDDHACVAAYGFQVGVQARAAMDDADPGDTVGKVGALGEPPCWRSQASTRASPRVAALA